MKCLLVETERLIHNLNIIKEKADGKKIIAVLKGNCYGLGASEVAKVLIAQGIDFFAVSRIEEAIELREAGIDSEILVLCSTCIADEASIIIRYKLTATIGSAESAILLNGLAEQYGINVNAHIKIDTGFGRYGFLYYETDKITDVLKFSTNINFNGIYTHFTDAFGRNKKHTLLQYERFNTVLHFLKKAGIEFRLSHISNSCALFRFPEIKEDAVRIGSAITGRIILKNKSGLRRVGVLESTIQEIKWLPKGYNIGYGNAYKTKEPLKVAVIPVGGADGLGLEKEKGLFRIIDKLRYILNDLRLSKRNGLKCRVNGKAAAVLGRSGYTSLTIDVTNIDCKTGDKCEFEINPMYLSLAVERKYV